MLLMAHWLPWFTYFHCNVNSVIKSGKLTLDVNWIFCLQELKGKYKSSYISYSIVNFLFKDEII